ncbi:unnamed protein product [Cylindrotheca closterium]|uniref:Uncharacterized protein n=1 Tax=Cylindrotheca closterium TaxID=2856 RepID=A0AAD2CPZ2_9STRA|nr:unnamed protein product [Cylindrotheca closterium]
MATFEEPIGPLADLSELLYVVALHQAEIEYREDVSVNAVDISLFLISRYGVQCSPENVENIILKDVAGKKNGNVLVTQQGDANQGSPETKHESMAEDMSIFLRSKFGVTIQAEDLKKLLADEKLTRIKDEEIQAVEQPKDQVKKDSSSSEVQKSADENDDIQKMDLMELVAMLMIPEFRKLQLSKSEGSAYKSSESFDFVVNTIIHDLASFGSSKQPSLEVTPSMVRDLFLRYGENTLAQDKELIEEMVKAARTGLDDNAKAFLDSSTFTKALTQDIQHYNVDSEGSISTNYADVFGNQNITKEADETGFVSKSTAETIDLVAHTYFCRIQMMLNWLFFVFTYFAYIYGMTPSFSKNCGRFEFMSSWPENKPQAGCNIANSILDWLIIFGLISVAGMLFVGLGSIGNNLKQHHLGPSLFAMAFLIFLTVYFPLTYGLVVPGKEPSTFIRLVALAMGFMTTLARLRLMAIACLTSVNPSIVPFTSLKSEAAIKNSSALKVGKLQENAFAVHEKLTESSAIRSYFGQALSNFSKLDPQYRKRFNGDKCRQDFMSGRIVNEDGIFLSGRLLSGNLAQLLLCVAIMGFGVTATRYVRDNFIPMDERENKVAESLEAVISLAADQSLVQEAVDRTLKIVVLYVVRVLYFLDNAGLLRLDCILLSTFLQTFCERAFYDDEDDGDFACSLFSSAPEQLCESLDPIFRPTTPLGKAVEFDGFVSVINTTSLVDPFAKAVSEAMSGNIASQINILYPRHRDMVVVPVAVAAGVATLCSLVITMLFLLSITATTLKLRTGVIQSVCDPNMRRLYTLNANSGNQIFGSMFWGIIASSVLVGGIVGFVVFISMWQVTAYLMMQAVALCIGISATLFFKWLIKRTCRSKLYRGFYRNNPLRANLAELVNESFNFATSMAFAVIRMFKLLFLAAFYVGRIDTKFLAPSANKFLGGKVHIDIFPDFFIADILSTEAHRHPYMERLGTMYLYKLKYGAEFATRAGSAWRLLFVTALMPWLQKYRIASRRMIKEESGSVHSA